METGNTECNFGETDGPRVFGLKRTEGKKERGRREREREREDGRGRIR